jgi:O-acetyl-ADP-ribose deacetylase (regulator of RNase III)
MEIILSSLDDDLYEAWQKACGDLKCVTLHRGSILDLECDAVVSPANSFGFMDGGIDMLYSKFFGWQVQEKLQRIIKEQHHGELLVGSAELVPTGYAQIPYLIAAPTMRVPMELNDTVNPYLAARAVLLLIEHGRFRVGPLAGQPLKEQIKRVAFPGLGTGVGRVPAIICAHQVRAAISEVVLGRSFFPESWLEAQDRHQWLYDLDYCKLQYFDN